MSNPQLLALIIAVFGLLLIIDRRRFKSLKSRHNYKKLNQDCQELISKIGRASTVRDLDTIENEAFELLANDADNEVWKNATFVLEHFKMRRYELYGNVDSANECADRISKMMKQNPKLYGSLS